MLEGSSLTWWITVVEIPSLAGLFWLVWRNRRDHDYDLAEAQKRLDAAIAQARESLAAYKLEVAKNYVSMPYMKDVERRLTDHLLRIEAKLGAGQKGEGRVQ
ncbi:hypothetical protein [Aestuariispira ectoiniformans]|uniref:hypothetical protein n=1 Tax=Aestuariispira ectoiniformans TaxID=2775080 RepID=UPI00223ABB0E|nr:hypothetical protein [Aestuariispira ectoiniformans]